MLRHILSVGGWTLVSRATGFVRDVVMAALLGAGPIADAFVIAFRLPNHFRAIFGEGAFNAAFVPGYGRLQAADRAEARLYANRILVLLLASQAVLLVVALTFMPGFVALLAPGLSTKPETFELAVALTRITFPYLLLITVVTLVSAVLNAHERFWAAAAAPILLNLSMIAALAASPLFPTPGHAAATGVAVSGLLQLGLVWWDAARAGLQLRPSRPLRDRELGLFFRRLGPATVGSAGVQIAMFADTIIASALPTGALASLYYAERLYQLPLGVVGIAAGTVLLPQMSRLVASGDAAGAARAQERAIAFTLALAAPCAVAFLTVPDLIMTALFRRGAFDEAAAIKAGAVLAAYAVGLPGAVITRSVTASFYARSDTATPLWASLTGYAVNIGLKLALVVPLATVGLALATSAGAWTSVGLLWLLAARRGFMGLSATLAKTLLAIVGGCAVLALVALALPARLGPVTAPFGAWSALAALLIVAGTGALAYGSTVAALLQLLRVRLRRA